MDKAYIKRKIENCKNLIENAISDTQSKVYEGYLLFWQEKLKPDYKALIKEFKVEFPDKKAYYKRNGKIYITKAFKEFIKK